MKKSKILGILLIVTIMLISIVFAIFESWAWPVNNNLNVKYDRSKEGNTIPESYRIWHQIYDDIWVCEKGHILTQSYSYLDGSGSNIPNSTREDFYAAGAKCTYKVGYGKTCGAAIVEKKPNTQRLVSARMGDMVETYKNLYCVTRNQDSELLDSAGSGGRYNVRATAKAMIRGENVTFEKYDYNGNVTKTVVGNKNKDNNIIAAIVSIDDIKIDSKNSLGFGYYTNKDEGTISKRGAQCALWMCWDDWIEDSGASQAGFKKGNNRNTL